MTSTPPATKKSKPTLSSIILTTMAIAVVLYVILILLVLAITADGNYYYLAVPLYFAPVLVAAVRKHPNGVPIAIVNLFLGWSIVGWVVALAWSFSATDSK